MRPDIIAVLYSQFGNMTTVNGYYYNWETVESKGNGSLALKAPTTTATAKANISFGNAEELLVVSGGRSLVQVPMVVCANVPYLLGTLEEHDTGAELVRGKMLSDLRNGFRFVTGAMCAVGVQLITGMQEQAPEVADGSLLYHVKVEFSLQYFE